MDRELYYKLSELLFKLSDEGNFDKETLNDLLKSFWKDNNKQS